MPVIAPPSVTAGHQQANRHQRASDHRHDAPPARCRVAAARAAATRRPRRFPALTTGLVALHTKDPRSTASRSPWVRAPSMRPRESEGSRRRTKMTTGQSGAKAPDRNRGRSCPRGPRRRAAYEALRPPKKIRCSPRKSVAPGARRRDCVPSLRSELPLLHPSHRLRIPFGLSPPRVGRHDHTSLPMSLSLGRWGGQIQGLALRPCHRLLTVYPRIYVIFRSPLISRKVGRWFHAVRVYAEVLACGIWPSSSKDGPRKKAAGLGFT